MKQKFLFLTEKITCNIKINLFLPKLAPQKLDQENIVFHKNLFEQKTVKTIYKLIATDLFLKMEGLTVILVSILGFCVMFHFLAHYFKPYSRLKMLKDAKRILIITSHPDDETMFFGPTILSLCRGKSNFKSANLFLLCMSTGDHKNMGSKRKHELYNACKILGIPEENITILRY